MVAVKNAKEAEEKKKAVEAAEAKRQAKEAKEAKEAAIAASRPGGVVQPPPKAATKVETEGAREQMDSMAVGDGDQVKAIGGSSNPGMMVGRWGVCAATCWHM